MLCCQELPSGESLRFIGRIFRHCPFDALNEGILSSYLVHIWYRKTRMAELQSGEGRMMIDPVVWAQYITWQTHSHVAIANAALRRAAKTVVYYLCSSKGKERMLIWQPLRNFAAGTHKTSPSWLTTARYREFNEGASLSMLQYKQWSK